MNPQPIIIADGDSWASYPKFLLTGGGLVDHLEDVLGIPITNFAHPGDSTLATMGLAKSQRLEQILPGADVLIFSGGGDDIAGDPFCIWLNQNAGSNDLTKAINRQRLNAALALVVSNYEDLAALRDRLAPNCLIVTHSYDFPPAEMMGVGVMGLLGSYAVGPWLKPGLDYCGWTNPAQQAQIVKLILQEFEHQMSIFAKYTPNVLHVNTQGAADAGDWGNEMHLTSIGWTKVAKVMAGALIPKIVDLMPAA